MTYASGYLVNLNILSFCFFPTALKRATSVLLP